MKLMLAACLVCFLTMLTGCKTAAEHQQTLHTSNEQEMTVGVVQKEIRHGMSQADVATALGSPNIVTRDKSGLETWIYDKISTTYSYSESGSSVGGAAGAGAPVGGALVLGMLTGSHSQSAGASATTQKTLTVIIKFKDALVENYTYHSSKF